MLTRTGEEFDDISLIDESRQLTEEGSNAEALAEPFEEHLRYERMIRELTEFEEAFESETTSAMYLPSHADK